MTRGRDEDPHGPTGEGWSEASEEAAPKGFAGSWTRVRPRFDDPMSWSVPTGRIGGIDIRLHLFFLIFIAIELLRSAFPAGDALGTRLPPSIAATAIGLLVLIVLLHEFGHCIACRRDGGVADEILLWPLGGLAACEPRHEWAAHLRTALGGPLVNVFLLAITMPTLGWVTGRWWGVALPSPFSLEGLGSVLHRWDLIVLYLANWLSLVLLLFNLLPLFPLDGGRILQAILWPKVGFAPAMRIACRAGFVGAILLAIVGFWLVNFFLVLIAVFGGLTCVQTLRQLEFTERELGLGAAGGDETIGSAAARRAEEEAERRAAERERARRQDEAARRARDEAEFDRILDKIRTQGLASLSGAERKTLERETERRRRGG